MKSHSVMAGLVPAIHVLLQIKSKTWITGTSPVMTKGMLLANNEEHHD
jgi:hypothetical protein